MDNRITYEFVVSSSKFLSKDGSIIYCGNELTMEEFFEALSQPTIEVKNLLGSKNE